MKSIYIGVCKTREDERFKKSFRDLTDALCSHYSICINVQRDRFLPDAQNSLARACIDNMYDYLILLDDDQWGHTKEMVDCLVGANALVATMKTYSRHYPYSCALMAGMNDNGLYVGIENGNGYQEVDMCGFPMTLIKRQLFEMLDYPYFTAVEALGRNWHTDLPFYQRLSKMGIKPVGCFQHCLNHDKVTQENVMQLRHAEIRDRNKKVLLDELYIKHKEYTRRNKLVGKA